MLEQQIVHLPESPMLPGGLGRLGRQLRAWMDLGQREVPEGERELVAQEQLELLHDSPCAAPQNGHS